MASRRLVETFIEVARVSSFSAAAKVLQLSPASVSMNVRHLEDELGVKLFERTTRQVRLTAEGERYRAHVAPAVEALHEAAEVVRADRDSLTGTLKVTSTTAFGRDEVMPVLARFQARHPALTIELHLSDQFSDMVAEGYDVAIRAGILPENEYIARLLLPVTPMLCASSAYIAEAGMPGTVADLENHRLIGMRSNPSSRVFAWEFDGPNGVVRTSFSPAFVVNDPAGLVRAATLGMGIAQIGSNLARPAMTNGDLLQLLPETAVRSRGIYALYPSRRFVPRKVTAFVVALTEAFEQRPDLL